MNIHRKDRAKLREFLGDNLLSLDIANNTTSQDSSPLNSPTAEKLVGLEDEKCSKSLEDHKDVDFNGKNLANFELGEDDLTTRLQLFPDVPSTSCDREEAISIDLELRLGPEPQNPISKGP